MSLGPAVAFRYASGRAGSRSRAEGCETPIRLALSEKWPQCAFLANVAPGHPQTSLSIRMTPSLSSGSETAAGGEPGLSTAAKIRERASAFFLSRETGDCLLCLHGLGRATNIWLTIY